MAVKLCTGTATFSASWPAPISQNGVVFHNTQGPYSSACPVLPDLSALFFKGSFHILLYCLDPLQIQFLISYWLNFIFFFRPRAHLPFNPGFSSSAGREALISLGPAAMPFKHSSGQWFSWSNIVQSRFLAGTYCLPSASVPFSKEHEGGIFPEARTLLPSNVSPFSLALFS